MFEKIPFNINDYVYIKLTDYGKEKLKENFEKEISYLPEKQKEKIREHFKIHEEDKDGWSKWQLWDLMNKLGKYWVMGCENVFETKIFFEVKKGG
ncbi:hypothetical protein M0P25_05075 [archaeon]|jgi:hypothetical protein|nr:hypothetical protein [archaeon]MCK9439771.1 hypothetical protein [Patescibacteria group bacterium]